MKLNRKQSRISSWSTLVSHLLSSKPLHRHFVSWILILLSSMRCHFVEQVYDYYNVQTADTWAQWRPPMTSGMFNSCNRHKQVPWKLMQPFRVDGDDNGNNWSISEQQNDLTCLVYVLCWWQWWNADAQDNDNYGGNNQWNCILSTISSISVQYDLQWQLVDRTTRSLVAMNQYTTPISAVTTPKVSKAAISVVVFFLVWGIKHHLASRTLVHTPHYIQHTCIAITTQWCRS